MTLPFPSSRKLKAKHILPQFCVSQPHHFKVSQPTSRKWQLLIRLLSWNIFPNVVQAPQVTFNFSHPPRTSFSVLLIYPEFCQSSSISFPPYFSYSNTPQVLPILNTNCVFKALSFLSLRLLLYFRPSSSLIRAVSAAFWLIQLLAICSQNGARVIFHKFKLDHVIFPLNSPSVTLPCLQDRVQALDTGNQIFDDLIHLDMSCCTFHFSPIPHTWCHNSKLFNVSKIYDDLLLVDIFANIVFLLPFLLHPSYPLLNYQDLVWVLQEFPFSSADRVRCSTFLVP